MNLGSLNVKNCRENVSSINELGTLENDIMLDAVREAALCAVTSDLNVLIIGETGVGKEVIARGIHNKSRGISSPFVSLNCSSIPDTLFESEFFGYCRGAFTGAMFKKRGFAELANGGTLFLDEITELHPRNQAKLLRIIETKIFYPLGSEIEHRSDFRLLCASNRSLNELRTAIPLRSDLFYRIGAFVIEIPPLREQKEIILRLTSYFIRQKKMEMKLSDRVLEFLLCYSFPGNIRELKNLINYAITMAGENTMIDLNHFPQSIQHQFGCLRNNIHIELPNIVNCFSRAYVNHFIHEQNISVEEAAIRLGVSRATIYRILNYTKS